MDKTTYKSKVVLGHSENEVKVKIYIAIITFISVAKVKQNLKTPLTQYQILQILS